MKSKHDQDQIQNYLQDKIRLFIFFKVALDQGTDRYLGKSPEALSQLPKTGNDFFPR